MIWIGCLGFLGSPYERDGYLGISLESQTTGPQTTAPQTISWLGSTSGIEPWTPAIFDPGLALLGLSSKSHLSWNPFLCGISWGFPSSMWPFVVMVSWKKLATTLHDILQKTSTVPPVCAYSSNKIFIFVSLNVFFLEGQLGPKTGSNTCPATEVTRPCLPWVWAFTWPNPFARCPAWSWLVAELLECHKVGWMEEFWEKSKKLTFVWHEKDTHTDMYIYIYVCVYIYDIFPLKF